MVTEQGSADLAEALGTAILTGLDGDAEQDHLEIVRRTAAAEAEVRRIVYTSFVGARPDATFTLARQHHAQLRPDLVHERHDAPGL